MAVVYKVQCECGKELTISNFELDSNDDLIIEVESCRECIDAEVEEMESDMQDKIDEIKAGSEE